MSLSLSNLRSKKISNTYGLHSTPYNSDRRLKELHTRQHSTINVVRHLSYDIYLTEFILLNLSYRIYRKAFITTGLVCLEKVTFSLFFFLYLAVFVHFHSLHVGNYLEFFKYCLCLFLISSLINNFTIFYKKKHNIF